MLSQSPYGIYVAFIAITALISGWVIWLLFYFYTVKRIEKQFKNLGIERNKWDPFIFRVFWYSLVIIFKTKRWNGDDFFFLPVDTTRRLATRTDYILSILLWLPALLILAIVFLY